MARLSMTAQARVRSAMENSRQLNIKSSRNASCSSNVWQQEVTDLPSILQRIESMSAD